VVTWWRRGARRFDTRSCQTACHKELPAGGMLDGLPPNKNGRAALFPMYIFCALAAQARLEDSRVDTFETSIGSIQFQMPARWSRERVPVR